MYIIGKLYQLRNNSAYDEIDYIIANYLIKNLNKIDQISLKKIIKDIAVSKSTITRFCQDVGFDGYLSLRNELSIEAHEIFQKLYYNKTINLKNYQEIKDKYFQECFRFITNKQLADIVKTITSSKSIVLYGDIFYCSLFLSLSHYVNNLYIPNLWSLQKQEKCLDNLTADDLLIIVSVQYSYFSFKEMAMLKPTVPKNLFTHQAKRLFIGSMGASSYDKTVCLSLVQTRYNFLYQEIILEIINKIIIQINRGD